ncbi:hypothetical protein [Desulforhabdus sp. TSK]|uniref:hypothetical protein n=1 Tax=Desulforhabdus sp. TSK TaxID=2925014 RepID=UPI001FC86B24|nr:hypothetical protein [Desulforhabdus sp. TSK]GKT09141.1 hypothetical protein DSTSK_24460 [Desulforhabdus sp. TSK]
MHDYASRGVHAASEARERTNQAEKTDLGLRRSQSPELRENIERAEMRDVPLGRRLEQGFRDDREHRRIFAAPQVEGFEKSGVVTNWEIRRYLEETFPDRHCNNITMESVRYSDQYVGDTKKVELGHWADTKPYPGMDIHNKDITINCQTRDGIMDREELKNTIAHEVGHQVHRAYLEPSHWTEWTMLSGDRPAEKCVSDYARQNAYEDFAESYMAYVRNPEALQDVSPEKYGFMRDRVFDGKEYNGERKRTEG